MSTPLRRVTVSTDTIARNVEALRALAPARDTMVVVKANGYGHGAIEVARAALDGGATWLGVADVTEALELRRSGITAPTLAWLHAPDDDFVEAVAADVTLAVSSVDQIERVAAVGGATVHIKVDTGLGRNGVGREDRNNLLSRAAEIQRQGRVRVEGLMSHVSGASREADLAQADDFLVASDAATSLGLEFPLRHLAASAAALDHPSLRFSMVRFGIAAYGLAPTAAHVDLDLTPAMTFESTVLSVKSLRAGDGVSYNHLWRASESTSVALVGAGYADGIPRSATGSAEVEIRGHRYPVVGRIAMDQVVVDVGSANVSVGDRVGIWGDPSAGTPTATEWAEWADTISYDIVTGIGSRVIRTVRA